MVVVRVMEFQLFFKRKLDENFTKDYQFRYDHH